MSAIYEAPQTASTRNLRRLFWLRAVAIFGQCVALWIACTFFALELPLEPLLGAVGSLGLLNLFTWWRLGRAHRISDIELLLQLLTDILLYSVLFYYSGGYTNPFVWMYLLPLSVAAVALPWRFTWIVAALSIAAYTALMFYYQPHQHQHHDASDFSMHLLGMWFGFVVSAGIIAYFVARIGNNLREYDHLMAQAREKALESERMLALGTLATAAAHELGTPLATMAVVIGELAADHAGQPALAEPLAVLRTQIQRCKQILTSITASAGQQRAEEAQDWALDVFLEQTVARWQDMHPAIRLDALLQGSSPAPVIAVDRTLGQALVNLLDNAADASPGHIAVEGRWTAGALKLTIRDYGPGLTPEATENAGTPFFTTKADDGLGLGLYLARLIFERFGGSVSLSNHAQGGAVTSVQLPLQALLL
ncbi:MAG TPA: ATP-binding protein [Novimethylophilus sp.]|jgi:two-component system sensor histidine kinase RegB|uniref:ATP-binding protein n=1 Tax=Novimethylophilus sp. TaxID=2137426 RepID=UPI002F42381E